MPAHPGLQENNLVPALAGVAVAIVAVTSPLGDQYFPEDFFSHVIAVFVISILLFALFVKIKSSYREYTLRDRDAPPRKKRSHVGDGSDRKSVSIMHGVVEKFSEKKGWGTISVRSGEGSDSETDCEAPRVRFLRAERDRLDLRKGDRVRFRAIKDEELTGWLLAAYIWRPQEAETEAPSGRVDQEHLLRRSGLRAAEDADND
eukprot:TRINITY_DN25132_c0_g1_i1.p1 TRINITY_DN25132_c0_g1~~TRINITY_DN25132_c0_g1_i1.p1  ORF type:complete len:203 (+),score=23.22 TRINITY_DN25132_c0_g1_i1:63-671(+)